MTTPTPQPLDLDAIRARIEGTTPGPWEARGGWIITPDDTVRLADVMDHEADAEFIAHARDDVPALLAEVEALRTKYDELGGELVADAVKAEQALSEVTAERDGLAAVIEQVRALRQIPGGHLSPHARHMLDNIFSAAPSDALAEVKREAALVARAEAWEDATTMARAAEGARALRTLPDALHQCATEARTDTPKATT